MTIILRFSTALPNATSALAAEWISILGASFTDLTEWISNGALPVTRHIPMQRLLAAANQAGPLATVLGPVLGQIQADTFVFDTWSGADVDATDPENPVIVGTLIECAIRFRANAEQTALLNGIISSQWGGVPVIQSKIWPHAPSVTLVSYRERNNIKLWSTT